MATQVREASNDQAELLEELVEEGLLIPSGVPGIYGHNEDFEDVRLRLEALLTREALRNGAKRLRFPPLLPRKHLEMSGYLGSFPHLCGTVYAFEGTEAEAATQYEQPAVTSPGASIRR